MTDAWDERAHLRGTQYKTDANLAARQSIYAYQHPRIDLPARVLDLAGPVLSGTIVDVGCGNGIYLAELAKRGFYGRVIGVDLSPGMLTAARASLGMLAESAGVPSTAAQAADQAAPTTRVALACADATALPLPDGTADLTLAPHMLYHVPEPAAALRELRRVTRPGGQVVIVLNGAGHLRQLRAAIAAARGDDAAARGEAAASGERVTLDDGESMARSYFDQVTRYDIMAELRVPAPGPIADYVRSLPGTRAAHPTPGTRAAHSSASPDDSDQADIAEIVAAAFPKAPEGYYVITSHAGCLICQVG
jgi:SAM-dependent methyltransferase